MDWAQFKDSVFLFLAGAVVASWFLTQEVAGSNPLTTNILATELANSVKTLREN